MNYEATNIISRIEWCRLQQQAHSVTSDERAGWLAEEAGLLDALNGKDRIAVIREQHQAQFIRYQCGFEDGQALLRLSRPLPSDIRRVTGLDQTSRTRRVWEDRRFLQAPSRVGSRR